MYTIALLLFPLTSLATLNGHCSGSKAVDNYKTSGICIRTSTCNDYHGEYISGACPNDPNDVKCCIVGKYPNAGTNPCGQYSVCDWTANACGGSWKTGLTRVGYCPGGDNYKCCKI
ncbi:hypothetical protein EJ04DRAFT_535785 [Polyplosphaeria fusca]|uniref:Uncharacterized protein n=1 Tax=Polyplosphaeria fusca TaxID=682080 RepID=A0A9P4V185_9PLEO|nr:hypothetical protein EJ04DRAFT_535785 [Polyplosphaeria fusca]